MDHPLGDVLNIAVYAYAAAVYSKDLSENATRGRRSEGEKGWWVNGQAPWGTNARTPLRTEFSSLAKVKAGWRGDDSG